MKKTALFILIFSFAAALLYAQSEEETENEFSPGSSPIKRPIAGFTVIAPEDARVSTDGKTTSVEDIYLYTGRKFKAVEARLKKIEAFQEEINNNVKSMEKRLSDTEIILFSSKEPAETSLEASPQETQAP